MPSMNLGVGTMFVRIALDQISDMDAFSRMSTAGEVVRSHGVG